MKRLIGLLSLILLLSTSARSELFPAREVWRVQTANPATCLGPSWLDGGRPCFLIGTTDRVLIIRDGNVIWISPSLDAKVTALARVDFGTGDGMEIIAGVETDSTAGLIEFKGEDFRDTTQFSLFGKEIDTSRGDWDTLFTDNRPITLITTFDDQFPDSSKSVTIFSQVLSWDSNPDGWVVTTGRINRLSLVSGEFTSSPTNFSIARVFQLDWQGDGHNDLITMGRYEQDSYGFGCEERHRFAVLDQNIRVTQRWETPTVYFDWMIGATWPLAILPPLNGTPRAIVACDSGYRWDGLHSKLAIFSSVQNDPQEVILAVSGPIADILVNHDANGRYWLVYFNQNGAIITTPLDDLWSQYPYDRSLPAGLVRAGMEDYNGDGHSEMVFLTTEGLFYYEIGDLSVPPSPEFPFSFSIFHCYPNPFNSSTTIEYSLPRPGRYALSVVDITGREVERLSDGWKEAGSYREVWNGRGVAGGMYIVQMNSESSNACERIQLVK